MMSSVAIATILKMMESLPETVQEQVAQHLREYIEDLQDEVQWDRSFQQTQPQLVARARQARQAMAEEQAKPLDHDQL